MNLHDVNRGIRRHKKRKRVGRGTGSGLGKTSTRGHKGQGQNSGWSQHPGFEGGQMPVIRRVPKRGFHNQWADVIRVVNLGQLDSSFEAGEEVNPETLRAKHLVQGRYDYVKVLAKGELTKKLKVSAHRFSQAAREAIEKAGGEVVVLPPKTPVAQRTKATAEAT